MAAINDKFRGLFPNKCGVRAKSRDVWEIYEQKSGRVFLRWNHRTNHIYKGSDTESFVFELLEKAGATALAVLDSDGNTIFSVASDGAVSVPGVLTVTGSIIGNVTGNATTATTAATATTASNIPTYSGAFGGNAGDKPDDAWLNANVAGNIAAVKNTDNGETRLFQILAGTWASVLLT